MVREDESLADDGLVEPVGGGDLRHGFASNALAAGISLYELSRYMGASVRVLEMHYAHLVKDAEATARTKLDAHAAATV